MSTIHKGIDPKGGTGHYIRETGISDMARHDIDCPMCKYGSLLPISAEECECCECGQRFDRLANSWSEKADENACDWAGAAFRACVKKINEEGL